VLIIVLVTSLSGTLEVVFSKWKIRHVLMKATPGMWRLRLVVAKRNLMPAVCRLRFKPNTAYRVMIFN